MPDDRKYLSIYSYIYRFAAVVTRRQPVAPNGCPMETEPPCTLSFSMGTDPTARVRVRGEAQSRRPSPPLLMVFLPPLHLYYYLLLLLPLYLYS